MQVARVVSADVLRQVKLIELRARRLVTTLFSGEYRSVFRGQGIEFAEVRAYEQGDDYRAIDWNVSARMGAPYVKTFVEERELTLLLVVDRSGSVEFGRPLPKSERAVGVAAEANADTLFRDAIDALVRWQLATRAGELPPYDEALLRREMALFPEWYLGRHLGLTLSAAQQAALEAAFSLLAASALAQPTVYVHRDYMPRNLMLCEPNPGVLDFQDAVIGPIGYDIASLLRDAFVSWEEARVIDWCARYWEAAKRAQLPVDADFAEFYRSFEWMGLQRHLKVLGIFSRLTYRDGKPKYLADTPRFLGYARAVTARYAALAPLARLLEQVAGKPK